MIGMSPDIDVKSKCQSSRSFQRRKNWNKNKLKENNMSPQLQVQAPQEIAKGTYANLAQIHHTKEEFVLDFMSQIPPQASLVARVVVSPAHAKRLAAVLANIVKNYEAQHGVIAAVAEEKQE